MHPQWLGVSDDLDTIAEEADIEQGLSPPPTEDEGEAILQAYTDQNALTPFSAIIVNTLFRRKTNKKATVV